MKPPRKRSPRKPIKLDPAKDHIIKFPHALTPENRASVIAFAQAMSHPASARPRGDRRYEEGAAEPEDAIAASVAKLAETVAEPKSVDAGEAYRAHRAENPLPALESYRRAAELSAPTPDHAIPRKLAPAEPTAHARPKPEPSWLRAIGEVLLCAACILIALPSVAVVIDTVIQLAIYLWEPVGHGLKAAAHWLRP